MPPNMAHMLIVHKSLQKLKPKKVKEYTKFVTSARISWPRSDRKVVTA